MPVTSPEIGRGAMLFDRAADQRRQFAHEPRRNLAGHRHLAHALELLEKIRENPEEAKVLIQGAEYTRCEIEEAAQREMVTKLEDFLRRRSKIALVMRKDDIRKSKGIKDACKILFGKEADKKFREYFGKA